MEKSSYVKVDGEIIDASEYSTDGDTAKITLSEDYLKTLAKGKHTLEIVTSDESIETEFFIEDEGNNRGINNIENPDDADSSNIVSKVHWYWWLLILLIIAGGIGISIFVIKKRTDGQNN